MSLAAVKAAGFMKTFGDARLVRSAHAAAMFRDGEQMLTEIIE
jgi:hypothetical protein